MSTVFVCDGCGLTTKGILGTRQGETVVVPPADWKARVSPRGQHGYVMIHVCSPECLKKAEANGTLAQVIQTQLITAREAPVAQKLTLTRPLFKPIKR